MPTTKLPRCRAEAWSRPLEPRGSRSERRYSPRLVHLVRYKLTEYRRQRIRTAGGNGDRLLFIAVEERAGNVADRDPCCFPNEALIDRISSAAFGLLGVAGTDQAPGEATNRYSGGSSVCAGVIRPRIAERISCKARRALSLTRRYSRSSLSASPLRPARR